MLAFRSRAGSDAADPVCAPGWLAGCALGAVCPCCCCGGFWFWPCCAWAYAGDTISEAAVSSATATCLRLPFIVLSSPKFFLELAQACNLFKRANHGICFIFCIPDATPRPCISA